MKKKIFIVIFLFLIFLVTILLTFLYNIKTEDNTEKSSSENKFNIYKIHYFSDVSTLSNETTFQNPEWNVNVYQYTDIAIYLERIADYDEESYIKNIYIDNIQQSTPKIGTPKLYYLNPLKFGDSDYTSEITDDEIDDKLEYNVMNYDNQDDDVKYVIPIFFEDCSNPITLRFINHDILENYIIEENTITQFNGTILKNENISIDDIQATISFDINIETENNEIHTINFEIEVPLENGDESILDGYIDITNENITNEF